MLGIGGGAALLLGGGGAFFLLQDGGSGGGLSYGSTVQGEITSSGPQDPFLDKTSATHTFQGSAGDTVEIEMDSQPLDTYLILEGPSGDMVAQDDDGGPGFNSEIVTTLPENGQYTIYATTYLGSSTGEYTLSLDQR